MSPPRGPLQILSIPWKEKPDASLWCTVMKCLEAADTATASTLDISDRCRLILTFRGLDVQPTYCSRHNLQVIRYIIHLELQLIKLLILTGEECGELVDTKDLLGTANVQALHLRWPHLKNPTVVNQVVFSFLALGNKLGDTTLPTVLALLATHFIGVSRICFMVSSAYNIGICFLMMDDILSKEGL